MLKKIRVRFAPSPTGYLHIGGLRTALYNYLFAKKNSGDFILRIEDTDKTRFIEDALENLLETLKKIGLDWDEGPISNSTNYKEKGSFGPYEQSKRLKIYQKYAQKLLEKEKAYYCFCQAERLRQLKEENQKNKKPSQYDGKCRNLDKKIIAQNIKSQMPYVIRLKIPREGETKFKDIIRGEIIFQNKFLDDQVLLKSDGYPTYHLANVIDDHLMKITQVIRGEEWLSSTPKHLILYQSFNWPPPQFAHLPLLLNADRSKLSKRQGDVAVEDYLQKGYLPEALINFVALLGWNPRPDKEIYNLKELIKEFDLKSVNKSGAVFNLEKLDWLNGHYIKQLDLEELTQKCQSYLPEGFSPKHYQKIVGLFQERLKKLSEIQNLSNFFFQELKYDTNLLIWKNLSPIKIGDNLKQLEKFLSEQISEDKWERGELEKLIINWIKVNNLTNGEVLWPMRTALSGEKFSPPPFDLAEIMGKKETLKRLREGINKLS